MIQVMTNRILVVEDEDRIRQFLQRGLTYENYRVDVAEASALELSITPHIGGGYSIATLQQFCVAP